MIGEILNTLVVKQSDDRARISKYYRAFYIYINYTN